MVKYRIHIHFNALCQCHFIVLYCARVECFQISAGDAVCSDLTIVNHLTFSRERNGNVQQEITPQNITRCQVIALEFKMMLLFSISV